MYEEQRKAILQVFNNLTNKISIILQLTTIN